MKIPKLSLGLMLLSLTACNLAVAPQIPHSPAQMTVATGFFRSALVKRPLLLAEQNGFRLPVLGLSGFGVQQLAKPAIAPMYYYGGHDFNQHQ